MKNKYICPKCKSQLRAYREYVFEKQQLISTKTGKPNKRVKSTNPEKVDMPGGVECTQCDFVYYGLEGTDRDGKEYSYLNEVFELIGASEDAKQIV